MLDNITVSRAWKTGKQTRQTNTNYRLTLEQTKIDDIGITVHLFSVFREKIINLLHI